MVKLVKILGVTNEKLEQYVKEKSHSIFSHGHAERSLSYILLLYQSCSELLYGQMIDKYCKKSGPLVYKEELTSYHIWIYKFLKHCKKSFTFLLEKLQVKNLHIKTW